MEIVKDEDTIKIVLPSTISTYLDPSFVGGMVDSLLLPEDQCQLSEIGAVEAVNWCVRRMYQVVCFILVNFDLFIACISLDSFCCVGYVWQGVPEIGCVHSGEAEPRSGQYQ